MNGVLLLSLLCVITQIYGQDRDESRLRAELEIADLELQDDCENLANGLKSSLLENGFDLKIRAEEEHAQLLRDQSNNLKMYYDSVPSSVQRNWTFFIKSGDTTLIDKDWNDLVTYYNGNEELMKTTTVHCPKGNQKCPLIKNVYENILENSKNVSLYKKTWSAWQNLLLLRRQNFPGILNLVKKAAVQNEQNDPKTYWEMLIDHENAYEKADALWTEIQPLYRKLQNFVKTRLFKFYGIETNNTEIPVYLLGSNFGNDWSYVADIVLPHPLIHHTAQTFLKKTSAENMYKLAENLTEQLSLGGLGDNFWKKSLFNLTFCENHILTYCSQEYSELVTCNKTTWVTYLNSFETAIDVALRNVNYKTLSRLNLRYSVINEAVKSFGSVLAISNMRHNGILDKKLFLNESDPNSMAELLLTALRILPKLPYYLAADKWRLHLLENGFKNAEKSWWQFRKELQGVEGVSNKESDFLGDLYIMANKPYLSKFIGLILQFQLLQSYKLSLIDLNDNIAELIGSDESFLTMIHERESDEWQNLIEIYYGSSELSASSLLDYFQPLEEYLDTAPLEQEKILDEALIKESPIIETLKVEQKLKLKENKNITVIEEPEEIHPRHIHENLEEGPNPSMEKISMYVGLGLLGAVAALLIFVIGSKKLSKRKRTTNRRFET